MSLGDVHMILMAFFARMSIVLTEDSDMIYCVQLPNV